MSEIGSESMAEGKDRRGNRPGPASYPSRAVESSSPAHATNAAGGSLPLASPAPAIDSRPITGVTWCASPHCTPEHCDHDDDCWGERASTREGPLSFAQLSSSNRTRCEGDYHPIDDWTPTDWATAAAGELGEALNKIKKARRTNYANLDQEREAIGHEIADTIIYLDLLCARLRIDLEAALVAKFNIVSERIGSWVKL